MGPATTSLHQMTPLLSHLGCHFLNLAESENNDYLHKIGKRNFCNSSSILFYAYHDKSFRKMKLSVGEGEQTHLLSLGFLLYPALFSFFPTAIQAGSEPSVG